MELETWILWRFLEVIGHPHHLRIWRLIPKGIHLFRKKFAQNCGIPKGLGSDRGDHFDYSLMFHNWKTLLVFHLSTSAPWKSPRKPVTKNSIIQATLETWKVCVWWTDFDGDEWEQVNAPGGSMSDMVYAPILDTEGLPSQCGCVLLIWNNTFHALGVPVCLFPKAAPEDVRVAMDNIHIPSDVMSFYEWGRTEICFGKTMLGQSYHQVAHGLEESFFYHRQWARSRLGNKNLLGKDFVKYLAVKERYWGVYEDQLFLHAQPRPKHNRSSLVSRLFAHSGWWRHGKS